MLFNQLVSAIQTQFAKMQAMGTLYRSSVEGSKVWDTYLTSFENDPIFRDPNSSVHNCNLDKNFIRRYGNIIAIDANGSIVSMFDIEVSNDSEYYRSVQAVATLLRNSAIANVFVESFEELKKLPYESCTKQQAQYQLGFEKNVKVFDAGDIVRQQARIDAGFGNIITHVQLGETRTFYHFNAKLNKAYVDFSGKSVESLQATTRTNKEILEKAMKVDVATYQLAIELIKQNSLLNAADKLSTVEKILAVRKEYDTVPNKQSYLWQKSIELGGTSMFINSLLGTTIESMQNEDVQTVCDEYNKRADPANYKKATSAISQSQINDYTKFVEENGYAESFNRRHATLADIDINEIRHINKSEGKAKAGALFGLTPTKVTTNQKRKDFDGVEKMSIQKFLDEILPESNSVEVFFESKHENNLSVITTADPSAKQMFQWNNSFSWTNIKGLAGKSQLAERVTERGGKVDGVFRFTHSWNEIEPNQSLMDLHVFMPGNTHYSDSSSHDSYGNGRRVGWNHRNDHLSGGTQDVDYTEQAPVGYIPVENITFPNLGKMPEGTYICKIHNWEFRRAGGKGRAEIAFGDQSFEYIYPATTHKQWITIAEVTLKNGNFTIKHVLPPVNETNVQKEVWGLSTSKWHQTSLICHSPNYWGDNNIGHKHYFFAIKDCKSDVPLRSFHTENLNKDFLPYRKVAEVHGNKMLVQPTNEQLAGLMFNATVADSVIVKVTKDTSKVYEIVF